MCAGSLFPDSVKIKGNNPSNCIADSDLYLARLSAIPLLTDSALLTRELNASINWIGSAVRISREYFDNPKALMRSVTFG
jgi:hypothetical protein